MTATQDHHRPSLPAFLADDAPPVLIFGGKGGVGKTTSAAATAVALAGLHPDESVVLVSTDPAHSIGDAIDGASLPANLRVEELDSDAEHAAFMRAHAGALREIASRGTFLEDTDIERFLDLSIPGVDELMSFLRLARWFEEEAADRFVIDTAPTGHALRLLAMPAVTGGWMNAVEALLGKHRYMSSVFGGGGGTDEVEAFVDDLQSAFDNIAAVWAEPTLTRFVPVFNAEPMSIAETERLLASLDALGIDAPGLICNRLVPPGAAGSLATLRQSQAGAMASLPQRMASRRIVGVPLDATEPRGDRLENFFASCIEPNAKAGTGAPPLRARVEGSVAVAGRFTLVAGKGGVGKTTVSCAAALTLAANGRTLLVSTDPAGSLSDALDAAIGAEPAIVAPNLAAIQLDADAELKALKDEYADEIEGFFDGLSVNLSFDREALENLLELAPTGLDEVMALVRMTEILEAAGDESYASIVIDTAPTGHTLRLLELPEVVQAWLEQIFAVLVKYEDMISLPRLNERLLRLSRGLKQLRAMLGDPSQTTLLAVTIPTRLAMAETDRLIRGAGRRGLPVSGVIVNQVTTAGGDAMSEAIASREQAEIRGLRDANGGRPLAIVYRGDDLRGVEALASLGRDLVATGRRLREAA